MVAFVSGETLARAWRGGRFLQGLSYAQRETCSLKLDIGFSTHSYPTQNAVFDGFKTCPAYSANSQCRESKPNREGLNTA